MSSALAIWYCVLSIVAGVLGWLPFIGGLLLVPCIVLFLVLMNSVKGACMTITSAQVGPAPSTATEEGSAGGAGGGLGLDGVIQVVSEGLKLAEGITKATE
jgi:hypothetical protein